MSDIEDKLVTIRRRIRDACGARERCEDDVRLLAVTKGQPVERLREAVAAGQRDFGENYVQEALPKVTALSTYSLCWHFIGPIQSNKTRAIAEHFHWVQSLDRMQIARRLNDQRPRTLAPINICIQVNISGETQKAGVAVTDLEALANLMVELPRLRLRGLMAIPARASDTRSQRQTFAELYRLYTALQEHGHALDTLSMGMSGDFEEAIAEGATLVRIGSALFGPRPTH